MRIFSFKVNEIFLFLFQGHTHFSLAFFDFFFFFFFFFFSFGEFCRIITKKGLKGKKEGRKNTEQKDFVASETNKIYTTRINFSVLMKTN